MRYVYISHMYDIGLRLFCVKGVSSMRGGVIMQGSRDALTSPACSTQQASSDQP